VLLIIAGLAIGAGDSAARAAPLQSKETVALARTGGGERPEIPETIALRFEDVDGTVLSEVSRG
jgi:hypothetical protein